MPHVEVKISLWVNFVWVDMDWGVDYLLQFRGWVKIIENEKVRVGVCSTYLIN